MSQIIFTDAEKAEIDRLVVKHSPVSNPIAGPALRLLQQEPRDKIVTEYETMLRTVTETALLILAGVEDLIEGPDDPATHDLVKSLKDMLLAVGNSSLQGRSTDEILEVLGGRGDTELSEACFRLSSDLVREILETRGLLEAIPA